LSIDQLKSLIKFSSGVIGGDTGIVHMGGFMQKPSVTIYTTSPAAMIRNSFVSSQNATLFNPSVEQVIAMFNSLSIKTSAPN
jgi:ADP-heptose:LPS heptosyltransferase